MRTILLAFSACGLLTLAASVPARDDDVIPAPSFDRIDHSRPQSYLDLHESFGNADRIRRVAETVRADTPEKTLAAIDRWIRANLVYDETAAYAWRNFDTAVETKIYGGCADHALIFAALARASGIPAVLVKTMDADWIREFRSSGTCKSWRGHVFLEVYLDGRWLLLDAQAMRLYEDYDPSFRLLPGGRYAYDKGSDPRELLLSLDWERWKKQTADHFAEFPLAELGVGPGRDVASDEDVYIAADSPVWQAASERLRTLGYRGRTSFNVDYDVHLKKAEGSHLVVTCVGEKTVPPRGKYGRYFPFTDDELKKRLKSEGAGVARHRLDDGTKVVFLYARDVAGMLELIRGMDLSPNP